MDKNTNTQIQVDVYIYIYEEYINTLYLIKSFDILHLHIEV